MAELISTAACGRPHAGASGYSQRNWPVERAEEKCKKEGAAEKPLCTGCNPHPLHICCLAEDTECNLWQWQGGRRGICSGGEKMSLGKGEERRFPYVLMFASLFPANQISK